MEPTRPSSRALLTSVLRSTVALHMRDWGHLFGLALIVFIPIGALEGVFDSLAETELSVAVALVALSVIASALIGEVLYSGAVAGLIAEPPEDGRHPSLAELARRLPILRLLAADVLVVLVVIFGAILLIVPGVIFFAWFAFVAPVIEIERRGVRDGFRRSRELVRGRFWFVLAVVGGLEILSEAAVTGIEELAHSTFGDGHVIEWLAETAADVIVNPPYAVILVLLAVELMREKPAAARAY
jgi:hypothetical protein